MDTMLLNVVFYFFFKDYVKKYYYVLINDWLYTLVGVFLCVYLYYQFLFGINIDIKLI